MIENINKNEYMTRKVLREITILRKLTEMDENIFTTKLIDIILPDGVVSSKTASASGKGETEALNLCDLGKLTHLFIVMEVEMYDLKTMLEMDDVEFEEDHIKTILYNLLCAISYVNSAGIMHRDIKPGNILIDD